MMIGGNDIIYPHRLSSDMLGFVLRTIEGAWPDAWVWVDGEYTNYHKMTIQDAIRDTVGSPGELLIYENIDAWNSWDREGANGKNGDQFIHLLMGENTTTFVVHHEAGVTQKMVADIQTGLDRHYPPLIKETDRARLVDFIQKTLAEKMKPFIDQEATPVLREQIAAVIRERLSELAMRLETRVPEVEAFINKSDPGVVQFRFLGPLDYKMHLALYNAGLVAVPPVEPYIVMTFTIGPEEKKDVTR